MSLTPVTTPAQAVWSRKAMPRVDSQRVVDTFVSAASIWAPSGKEKEMADKMVADFQALDIPGTKVQIDDAAERAGSNTGNVIVDIPASPQAPADARSICLSFHLDRVPVRAPGVPQDEPVQIEVTKDGIIRSKGERTNIAADDRTGYAAVKEGIQAIHLSGIPHGKIRVIGFVREEPGLFGARAIDPKHLQGLDYGFEMDGGKVGNVIRGSAGIRRFRAVIEGQSAPSIRRGEGKNALFAGMDVVQSLRNSETQPGQLLHISNFESGKVGEDGLPITNAVADTATIAGEIRARSLEDEAKLQARVDEAFAQVARSHGVTYQLSYDNMPGFQLAEDHDLVKFAELATRAAGSNPKTITAMGGSDANLMNAKGLPTVVLGSGAYLQHTEREYTTRNDLVRATQVVMSVLAASASPAVTLALAESARHMATSPQAA